jgi:flagellar hook-length control protein FliK
MPAASRLVPMGRVVENTAALLHLAANRGVTHARLNLKPVELGGIEVRLRSTAEGISAQLVADSPEAAKMLSQAGDDLRKQLADQNVNLLSLDVSTSGDQQQSAAQFAGHLGSEGGHRSPGRLNPSGLAADDDLTAPAPAESTLLLPTGVLVDVLA